MDTNNGRKKERKEKERKREGMNVECELHYLKSEKNNHEIDVQGQEPIYHSNGYFDELMLNEMIIVISIVIHMDAETTIQLHAFLII